MKNEKIFIMPENVSLSFETNNEMDEFEKQIKKIYNKGKKVQSGIGIEEITIFLNLVELAIMFAAIPVIDRHLENKTITVCMGGVVVRDPLNKLIHVMESCPKFVEDIKKAAQEHVLSLEGNAEDVYKFIMKMKELYNIDVER